MRYWVLLTFIVIAALYWRQRRARRERRQRALMQGATVGSPTSAHLQPYTRTVDIVNACVPGQSMMRDMRRDDTKAAATAIAPSSTTTTVRVLNWNIERGFKLPQLIRELRAITPVPDVILLQEVDIDCRRTNHVDVAAEIASALDMQYVFACDMVRVNTENENDPNAPKSHDPKDFKDNYGVVGAPCDGAEGQAILTRWNFVGEPRALVTPCVRNKHMPYHAHRKKHSVAVATVATLIGPITFYSAHFDAFAGRVARVSQYRVITDDAARHSTAHPVVIAGDFNTHNHGVARLIASQCGSDPYRWKAFGISEATWWQRNVFGDGAWQDPFDKERAPTIAHRVAGITVWAGKIDFMMIPVHQLTTSLTLVSNSTASDHQYLMCDLVRAGASSATS